MGGCRQFRTAHTSPLHCCQSLMAHEISWGGRALKAGCGLYDESRIIWLSTLYYSK